MKTTQTFSILFWANKAKSTSEGLPLFARITIDGKRAEISLKRKVDPNLWNPKASCVDGKSEVNNYIAQVKAELLKIYNQMQVLDENITAESLKMKFTGEKEEIKTLLQVIGYHNDQMSKMVGIDVVKITLAKYLSLRKKLVTFLKCQYKKSDIPLQDLNHKFVTNFEYFLKRNCNNSHNTAMKDIKNLKKVINQAVQNDWLEKNPFTNFKCSYKYVERQVLTMEEINLIETKEFKMPRLQHVRDLFIFSCYTGLAYADVMNLTQKSIVLGIDGERWIYTNRQKTDSRVRVPLLPKALAIIEKYKDNPLIINSGFLLPRLSNQKLNSYLDEIKNICEIDPYRVSNIRNHIFLKVYQCL